MKEHKSQPTMKDVARESGVSLGTVSKVMNGIPVGETYRRRVEAAAKKLGYQVNNYARGLKTNKTNCIAVLVPTLTNPFFSELVEHITTSLMKHQYRPILMLTGYDPETEAKCITMVRQNKVDGVIALTYNPGLEVDESLPFVTIDRHFSASIPCISSDNFTGGEMAAQKLMELGCRRLLFLRTGSTVPGEADKRRAGFENACRAKGITPDALILNDDDSEELFFRYLEEHYSNGRLDYDGIFCNTDRVACRILEKLYTLGIRVPEDVQVIGYDGLVNDMTGRRVCSTIVQPVEQMADMAVSILLNRDITAPALLNLPVRYAPGGTTREPAEIPS